MRQVPHDIDRTLWAIAESNDPRAIEEFGERYPAFRAELVARIELVRSFKSQRPDRQAPYLSLPQQRQHVRFGRGYGLLMAGALLATIALATVVSVKTFGPKPQRIDPSSQVQTPTSKPFDSTDTVEHPDMLVRPGDEAPPVADRSAGPSDPFDTPVDIDHKSASLKAVIQEIGQKAKLKLEIAPGFEDEQIEAHYAGLPAAVALDDLAQNFGFTVMRQEQGRALVIPAIDPSRPPVNAPGGSFSEPSGNRDPVGPAGAGKGQ